MTWGLRPLDGGIYAWVRVAAVEIDKRFAVDAEADGAAAQEAAERAATGQAMVWAVDVEAGLYRDAVGRLRDTDAVLAEALCRRVFGECKCAAMLYRNYE